MFLLVTLLTDLLLSVLILFGELNCGFCGLFAAGVTAIADCFGVSSSLVSFLPFGILKLVALKLDPSPRANLARLVELLDNGGVLGFADASCIVLDGSDLSFILDLAGGS